ELVSEVAPLKGRDVIYGCGNIVERRNIRKTNLPIVHFVDGGSVAQLCCISRTACYRATGNDAVSDAVCVNISVIGCSAHVRPVWIARRVNTQRVPLEGVLVGKIISARK